MRGAGVFAEQAGAADMTPVGGEVLDREPLSRHIARAVARDIIFGVLPAETPVSQDGLCGRFGTSRMPVRDALRALAAAGYLVAEAGNRLRVAHLSQDDLRDIFSLEATLAGLIASRAAERRTDEELAHLTRLQNEMLGALSRNDGASMSTLNQQFHEMISEISRSSALVAAYRNTTIHVSWRYYLEQPSRMRIGCLEHEAILTAIGQKDRANAQQLVTQHITDAQQYRLQARAGASAGADMQQSYARAGIN